MALSGGHRSVPFSTVVTLPKKWLTVMKFGAYSKATNSTEPETAHWVEAVCQVPEVSQTRWIAAPTGPCLQFDIVSEMPQCGGARLLLSSFAVSVEPPPLNVKLL